MANRNDEMYEQFLKFHKKHPQVWQLFKRFTFSRINLGFKNYAAQSIVERIRWETDQAVVDDDSFKMNNNNTAFYSRAFMAQYPQYEGFFRTRHQVSKDQPANGLPEFKLE